MHTAGPLSMSRLSQAHCERHLRGCGVRIRPCILHFCFLCQRNYEINITHYNFRWILICKLSVCLLCFRYFMYYWPIISSLIGIGSFFLLLSIFTMLSWQQCAASFWKESEVEEIPVRYTQPKPITYEERRSIMKRNMEQERLGMYADNKQVHMCDIFNLRTRSLRSS